MSLRDDLQTSLLEVFDDAVFAVETVIDGKVVAVVLSAPEKEPVGIDGLFQERRRIYCRVAEMAAPVTGQELMVNGERWHVGPVANMDRLFGAELTRFMA